MVIILRIARIVVGLCCCIVSLGQERIEGGICIPAEIRARIAAIEYADPIVGEIEPSYLVFEVQRHLLGCLQLAEARAGHFLDRHPNADTRQIILERDREVLEIFGLAGA